MGYIIFKSKLRKNNKQRLKFKGYGNGHRDLFCLSHASQHASLHASTSLVIIFGRIASGIPWCQNSKTVLMQLPYQCTCRCQQCWHWCCPYCYSWESDRRIAELCEMPQSFSIKLHSETHHALSHHPRIIICSSFISSIDYNFFYHITILLKWPFVSKNNAKQ